MKTMFDWKMFVRENYKGNTFQLFCDMWKDASTFAHMLGEPAPSDTTILLLMQIEEKERQRDVPVTGPKPAMPVRALVTHSQTIGLSTLATK